MGKPHKVFVLSDSIDYEGESILGVYSTMEKAKKAAVWAEENKGCWDDIYVYTLSLDDVPASVFEHKREKVK